MFCPLFPLISPLKTTRPTAFAVGRVKLLGLFLIVYWGLFFRILDIKISCRYFFPFSACSLAASLFIGSHLGAFFFCGKPQGAFSLCPVDGLSLSPEEPPRGIYLCFGAYLILQHPAHIILPSPRISLYSESITPSRPRW